MTLVWDMELKRRVATLTYNYPPKNFLDLESFRCLDTALDKVSGDASIRAVIIRSAMKDAFISGANVNIFRNLSISDVKEFVYYSQGVFEKMENFDIPIIAAIEGVCLGGGCEFALSCDIRVAGVDATFGQPEVLYGLIPGGGGIQRLLRHTNRNAALKMLLTGFSYKTEEALRIGVIDEVTDSGKAYERAKAIAGRIAVNSPSAVKAIKNRVNVGASDMTNNAFAEDAMTFIDILETDEAKEGLTAMIERRLPKYK